MLQYFCSVSKVHIGKGAHWKRDLVASNIAKVLEPYCHVVSHLPNVTLTLLFMLGHIQVHCFWGGGGGGGGGGQQCASL